MEHAKLPTRTAEALIRTINATIVALDDANNDLQESLGHLQLAQAGIEEKDWMRHPEHLDRDIEETQEASQFVFEVYKQVERLAQLTAVWKSNFIEDLPSESRNR